MRKVVVFRSVLLPRSEVFVQEQVQFLTNWKPLLVGYRWIKDGLDLQGLGATTIPGSSPKTVGRYALRLCQLLERPHPPTVATLRDTGAKLVHAHFGTDATDIWPSVRAAGLPMVVTLHGYDINIRREWWEAGKGGVLRRFYPRRLLTMAHEPAVYFIAVSHAIRCRAIEYGIPEDKITVSYIGVDTERFKPGGLPIDQRRKRILFVGRMVEKKAPLLLIRGYAEVRKQVPEAQLVMIGDGPLLKDAKRLARTLDVPVEFHGAQDSYAVQAQLHLARVLCLPSVTAENGDARASDSLSLKRRPAAFRSSHRHREALSKVSWTGILVTPSTSTTWTQWFRDYSFICGPTTGSSRRLPRLRSMLRQLSTYASARDS